MEMKFIEIDNQLKYSLKHQSFNFICVYICNKDRGVGGISTLNFDLFESV